MKKYLLFASLLLIGCGARKVQKTETEKEVKTETFETVENDVKTESNVKTEIITTVNDSTKEVIEETVITPIDNTKPATYTDENGKQHSLNNSKHTKRKTTRNKAVSEQKKENVINSKNTSDNTLKTTNNKTESKEQSDIKNIDKKQFDPLAFIISYWWLWLLILIALYVAKKYFKITIPFIK